MDLTDLKGIISLMQRSELTELEIEPADDRRVGWQVVRLKVALPRVVEVVVFWLTFAPRGIGMLSCQVSFCRKSPARESDII